MIIDMTISAVEKSAKNGQKFIVTYTRINGVSHKVSFRKECNERPTKPGRYNVTVDSKALGTQPGKQYVSKVTGNVHNEPSIIWVKDVIEIVRISNDELNELQEKEVLKLFGY